MNEKRAFKSEKMELNDMVPLSDTKECNQKNVIDWVSKCSFLLGMKSLLVICFFLLDLRHLHESKKHRNQQF